MSAGITIKLAGTLMDLALPWILAKMIDDIAPLKDMRLIAQWGLLMLLCAVLGISGNVVANRMAAYVARETTRTIRHDLFAKIASLSCRQVDELTVPSLESRLTSDTYYVHSAIGSLQRLGVRAPILMLGGMIVTLSIEPLLALVLIAVMPMIGLIVFVVSKKGVPLFKAKQMSADALVRTVRENITGIRVIKAFAKEADERARFDAINKSVVAAETKAASTMAASNPLINLLLNYGLTAVIIVGAFHVNSGIANPGEIIAFLSYFTIMLNAMLSITRMFVMMTTAIASAGRIQEVLSCPDETGGADAGMGWPGSGRQGAGTGGGHAAAGASGAYGQGAGMGGHMAADTGRRDTGVERPAAGRQGAGMGAPGGAGAYDAAHATDGAGAGAYAGNCACSASNCAASNCAGGIDGAAAPPHIEFRNVSFSYARQGSQIEGGAAEPAGAATARQEAEPSASQAAGPIAEPATGRNPPQGMELDLPQSVQRGMQHSMWQESPQCLLHEPPQGMERDLPQSVQRSLQKEPPRGLPPELPPELPQSLPYGRQQDSPQDPPQGLPHEPPQDPPHGLPQAANAIENISFAIKRGETLGIIGATGSGKSTLVSLLMRLYEPGSGSVLIGGAPIGQIPQAEFYRRFGVVFQRDILFADTIRENIDFGRDLGGERIEEASRMAQAFGFVSELPDKFSHMLSQKGTNISGGQKQRLLLSRAFAGDPEILILDDSSSALDYRTDSMVRRAIRERFGSTTSIVVAQRISSIMGADRILVMDEGRMLGYGSHEELLATCGVYREIAALQMDLKNEMSAVGATAMAARARAGSADMPGNTDMPGNADMPEGTNGTEEAAANGPTQKQQ
jgi:ABC-type multidrug transport system fused ATPase/permease subunit